VKQWDKIGLFPHHGICIPLFSLRSETSCGIGEFFDLIPLIQWCSQVGFDCIQLLPLNDTGDDPSPYNPISSCALDPIYLSLSALPDAGPLLSELSSFIPLNESPQLQRKEVKEKKLEWLHRYFFKIFSSVSQTNGFKIFVETHLWLKSYAQFKTLENPPFSIDFHIFLQYLCFSQLEKVRLKADAQSILLQGDLPILLSPDSVDIWSDKDLFISDVTAGAPPDYYNPSGQNWGFPIFNWDAMRLNHFAWWKQRLKTIENLYHLYRIDHVVGLFRIWAIPPEKPAQEGFFIPKDPSLWKIQGEEILQMLLDNSSLLPIAEDLGTIPDEVYASLKHFKICGTKVIRWEKDKHKKYIPYENYEPLSLTTVSTWDCDPLKAWWKNFPEEAQAFAEFKHWDYEPELSFEKLIIMLQDAHHTPSYFHINLLQEYLSLFPELIGDEDKERINIPGTILPSNWTYRFRPYLKEMLNHKGLQNAIAKILPSPSHLSGKPF
jgi:4-alpha-glucanotransferase